MGNVMVEVAFVDANPFKYIDHRLSCKDVVNLLFRDDFGVPPCNLVIDVLTESGKAVRISIPYSQVGTAHVSVDGEQL